jgi:hypothetical protein
MFFNDRRALKAANGPSLAPKGYKPDTAGRKVVKETASPITDENMRITSRKTRYNKAAMKVDREGTANSNDIWNSASSNIVRK